MFTSIIAFTLMPNIVPGQISPSELLHVNFENMPQANRYTPIITRLTSWPLVDWNLATLLWRSCGGLLLLIVTASIIPGRLHVLSGRILRWPVLALTYLTIASELIVYIMVRLFIRLAETVFSTPKHRELRSALDEASSYEEWLSIAKKLDYSKGREVWQHSTDDDTSYRYNWAYINELIMDMKQARREKDAMLALVVLQQCTRKNVGGIMNEDLFSFTNTGKPKVIVEEFLDEVCKTLKWLTEASKKRTPNNSRAVYVDALEILCNAENTNIVEQAISQVVRLPIIRPAYHAMNHVIGPVQWALEVATGGQKDSHDKIPRSIAQEPVIIDQDNHDVSEEQIEEQMFDQQREQVKTFLKRARASYGRTALCLSGGGSMGW